MSAKKKPVQLRTASDVVRFIQQVRESVRRLEQAAENEALLVRPSWAYCRGASAAAILAQKLEQNA